MKKLIVIFFLLPVVAMAQTVIKDSIYSTIMKEQRKIEVVLPDDYKPGSGARYDVTYVTDGEWNTKIVAQLQRFAQIQFMPANIIVSLPNTYINGHNMRDRELTPIHVDGNPVSGGADNYIAFIKTELIPYIEKKYPTKGQRTLEGGSLGGLFGLYCFFKEPELFQSYMLADPAFWYGDGFLMKMAAEKLPSLPNPERTILFTGREGAAFREMGVKAMDSIFHANAPATLHWKTLVYTGETHNSTIFKTVYDGLKYTYEGYTPDSLVFHPMAGIILKDKPFNFYCFSDERMHVRYTTDGTEPTSASPEMPQGMKEMNTPSQVTLKAFCARQEYNKVLKTDYKIGTVLTAVKKPGKIKPGGLDSIAGLQSGFLEIKEDGYYIFGLVDPVTDVTLHLGDQLLFDYKKATGNGKDKTFIIPLQKGFYPLHLQYTGTVIPMIIYLVPGGNETNPIPRDVLYHH
ncbi:Predicted hydrolase of the alpha/beta superfamily [Chitinophaga sp. YR573]|uniref:alpha/beta hydrolase-fold protein n=1 Tax=Chitinophaga sp. YR573 TaxID=1881040 RepID=UPI0008C32177|nr:alpha/beta hydrolase-fold protein [Chitinophaga sp. YR573]SEW15930.1 Predicted hydrolase of the alpha/beta superfamily [Chitinophaga sp. YR573]